MASTKSKAAAKADDPNNSTKSGAKRATTTKAGGSEDEKKPKKAKKPKTPADENKGKKEKKEKAPAKPKKKKAVPANRDCESENETNASNYVEADGKLTAPLKPLAKGPKKTNFVTIGRGPFKDRPLLDVVLYSLGTAPREGHPVPAYNISKKDLAQWFSECLPGVTKVISEATIQARINTLGKTYIDQTPVELPCPNHSPCTFTEVRYAWQKVVIEALQDFRMWQQAKMAGTARPKTFGSWWKSEREQISMLPQAGLESVAMMEPGMAMGWDFEQAAQPTPKNPTFAVEPGSRRTAVPPDQSEHYDMYFVPPPQGSGGSSRRR